MSNTNRRPGEHKNYETHDGKGNTYFLYRAKGIKKVAGGWMVFSGSPERGTVKKIALRKTRDAAFNFVDKRVYNEMKRDHAMGKITQLSGNPNHPPIGHALPGHRNFVAA